MSLNTFKTTNFYMKHRFRKFTEQVYSTEIGYKWRNNNVIRLIYLNEISQMSRFVFKKTNKSRLRFYDFFRLLSVKAADAGICGRICCIVSIAMNICIK